MTRSSTCFTGEPATLGPIGNGDLRPGDNLYTCCVLALRPSTGERVWHFQYTPHDVHDWDACQIQVLVDAEFQGKPRKLLVTANRNAFYYVLDRETGEFLHATPYAKQTWCSEIDERGRPVRIPGTNPTKEGVLVFPSLQGATNWFSPSYSPKAKTLYVAVREMGAYYYKSDVDFEPGAPFLGGGEQSLLGDQSFGWVRGLDVTSGEKKWEFKLHSPPWAGLLSTAGGVVFGGTDEGNFFALDGGTGESLWQFPTGGKIAANPISFSIEGKQQVVIAAGNAIFAFWLAVGS